MAMDQKADSSMIFIEQAAHAPLNKTNGSVGREWSGMEDEEAEVNDKHKGIEGEVAESESCDTDDRYTHSTPEATEHIHTQSLESTVQQDEMSATNNGDRIDAHQSSVSKGAEVKNENNERRKSEQIKMQRRHSGMPAINKKNRQWRRGGSGRVRHKGSCRTHRDEQKYSPYRSLIRAYV